MAGQLWVTNSLGGFMYADKLSRELRMAVQPMCKFRQFSDARDATKSRNQDGNMLGRGDLFTWNVYSDIGEQGGTLVETTTMPESNFTITQGTLTVNEYGNSVSYSGKLDDLSEQPVRNIIHKVLKNDTKKSFDIAAHAEFDRAQLRFVPSSAGTSTTAVDVTADGTATATNNISFRAGHARAISDAMKERNIPPFVGDDFVAVSWPTTLRDCKTELEAVHQYSELGFSLIHAGEIGRYENIRFCEQTFIPKGGANDSTTWNASAGTADAWDGGDSDWMFFFGDDTIAEGIVIAEEMRGKIPSDFGRSKGIAWYALEGYGLVHADTAAQARIGKWDSAV